ncbi:hypothetical protein Mnod_1430 [Methylobacterium nodulans ORS 2060]|uniref:Uncharacterized protein n=1 Tax=Methylobacterium nodulans (strain LMG 21967 / CNCM I-2342 / ORS 2060) TaxID=460265 RepID=B8INA1_METNO|nr:hypothetical protein Mnod_1430 [Methylobacterium nodulans ORS 2060]
MPTRAGMSPRCVDLSKFVAAEKKWQFAIPAVTRMGRSRTRDGHAGGRLRELLDVKADYHAA